MRNSDIYGKPQIGQSKFTAQNVLLVEHVIMPDRQVRCPEAGNGRCPSYKVLGWKSAKSHMKSVHGVSN